VRNDPLNCGDCNVRCNADERCHKGVCVPRKRP
jgi:hypothetical protein